MVGGVPRAVGKTARGTGGLALAGDALERLGVGLAVHEPAGRGVALDPPAGRRVLDLAPTGNGATARASTGVLGQSDHPLAAVGPRMGSADGGRYSPAAGESNRPCMSMLQTCY
jgi:hypothetical protein